MAKIEFRVKEMLEKQISIDPDFDIEIDRDDTGKIKAIEVNKESIKKLRDRKKNTK